MNRDKISALADFIELEGIKTDGLQVVMRSFFTHKDQEVEPHHLCKTAACVVGFCALRFGLVEEPRMDLARQATYELDLTYEQASNLFWPAGFHYPILTAGSELKENRRRAVSTLRKLALTGKVDPDWLILGRDLGDSQ